MYMVFEWEKMISENDKKEKETERIRKYAKYLSRKLYGVRFLNGKEITKLFKKEIMPLLEKQDVHYSIYFITGEQGLMTTISLGIENGFSFRREGEGQRYNILPELQRLVNNRYNGYKYYLKQYNKYSVDDLERLDERNYATGINEISIYIYKSHLDPSIIEKDIIIRFIDYIDLESLL